MPHGSGAPPEQGSTRTIGAAVLAVCLMSYPWLAPGLQSRLVFGVWALCIALAACLRAEP